MSLVRTRAALLRAQPARRFFSDKFHHNDDEHHHEHDSTQYPKEPGFFTAASRNMLLAGLAIAAAYKYAPEPTDDVYLTRWIAMYRAAPETWSERTTKHTAMEIGAAEENLFLNTARKPPMHRMQFPQKFDSGSPFSLMIGMNADVSDIEVKQDPKIPRRD